MFSIIVNATSVCGNAVFVLSCLCPVVIVIIFLCFFFCKLKFHLVKLLNI